MACIVFICNFLFINYDEKSSKEDILVDNLALDMAFEELNMKSLKKEKIDSSNKNYQI